MALWAYENNITSRTSKTTFSPNHPCTRAHVLTFLWRSLGKLEAPYSELADYRLLIGGENTMTSIGGAAMIYTMTNEQMRAFEIHLRMEEHSESTIEKYTGAVTAFYTFLPDEKTVTREQLLAWKNRLCATLAASMVNVIISAILRSRSFHKNGNKFQVAKEHIL